eukprot:22398-Lingulodinium_polyedra.AAC.1
MVPGCYSGAGCALEANGWLLCKRCWGKTLPGANAPHGAHRGHMANAKPHGWRKTLVPCSRPP